VSQARILPGHQIKNGLFSVSVSFRMDMAAMDGACRDANIIPRYNAAVTPNG
jgi:hypothetical protein